MLEICERGDELDELECDGWGKRERFHQTP